MSTFGMGRPWKRLPESDGDGPTPVGWARELASGSWSRAPSSAGPRRRPSTYFPLRTPEGVHLFHQVGTPALAVFAERHRARVLW